MRLLRLGWGCARARGGAKAQIPPKASSLPAAAGLRRRALFRAPLRRRRRRANGRSHSRSCLCWDARENGNSGPRQGFPDRRRRSRRRDGGSGGWARRTAVRGQIDAGAEPDTGPSTIRAGDRPETPAQRNRQAGSTDTGPAGLRVLRKSWILHSDSWPPRAVRRRARLR